jgi:ribosomal protein S18 acetylase RimI-like enzyme
MSAKMIDIRPATTGDLAAVAQVHVTSDWETYAPLFGADAFRLTNAESEDRWRRALEGGGLLLAACDRDAIVGLGHARGDRIDALYILPAYHRQGIDRAMLARLLDFLHQRGVAEARFDVAAANAEAILFYEAQGARAVGRCVDRDPRGDTEDLIFAVPTAQGGS